MEFNVSPSPRAEFKTARVDQAIRRKRTKIILVFAVSILAAGAMAGVVFLFSGNKQPVTKIPIVSFASVGQEHIPLGSPPPVPYNSNPPSSGGHFRSPANWKIYDYEVPDQIFIHNLEHGGIWIAYRTEIPPRAVQQLKEVVEEVSGSKVVMAPRSLNDTDIAVVAWTRALKFNLSGSTELSQGELNDIRGFYKAYKNKGPELVPDTMPGIDPQSVQP